MELYSVTIRGYKYYFCGNLSQNDCSEIDAVCTGLSSDNSSSSADELFQKLTRYISAELRTEIYTIQPEHIFRIN